MKHIRCNSDRSTFVFLMQVISQAVTQKDIRNTMSVLAEPVDSIISQTVTQSNNQIIIFYFSYRVSWPFVGLIKNGVLISVNGGNLRLDKFASIMFQVRHEFILQVDCRVDICQHLHRDIRDISEL